jgi:transformation/transcription domain-associated protein
LTPNLEEAIGPIFMEGRFIPSMATIAAAIKSSLEDIDPAFRLLFRDDIIAWYTSKSMAKSDSKTQDLEKQLGDRAAKNVAQVQVRIVECAPAKPPVDMKEIPTEPVNQKVRSLIEQATDPEKLCMMLPNSYQPWL